MPPKLPDFANISERLRKALRLEHRIVVIGLSDTPPANLPHYEGEPLKACQMLDTVRFEGKSFYTVQNDHYECKNAIRWLGFDESYEGHFSGEWATGDYPDNGRALFRAPAFSRRMYEESPKVRVGTVKCAYYMPLEKANEGPARGDEVAIFVLNPRQAMYLARGTHVFPWRHLLRHDRPRHLPERHRRPVLYPSAHVFPRLLRRPPVHEDHRQ